jgi:hypothetical protein
MCKERQNREILGVLLGTANLYNNTKRKHFAIGIDVEGIPYGSVGITSGWSDPESLQELTSWPALYSTCIDTAPATTFEARRGFASLAVKA